ncbi:MAG TPA: NEW3 domain-containing protein, partial [Roseiflexaceae bacterium]|nr:NEW3 domain-containing protein [Roseiflexaceae bacterium]
MPAKQRRIHIRNLAIALAVPLLIALMAGTWQAPVFAQTGATLSGPSTTTVTPGIATTLNYTLTNNNLGANTVFSLAVTNAPAGWVTTLSASTLTLSNNATGSFSVFVTPPSGASPGTYNIQVQATGGGQTFTHVANLVVSSSTGQATLTPVIQTVTGNTGQT